MRPMHERMERELFAEFSQKYGAPVTPNMLVCITAILAAVLLYMVTFKVSEEPAFRRRSATRNRPISTLSTRPLPNRPDSLVTGRPPSTNEPTIR